MPVSFSPAKHKATAVNGLSKPQQGLGTPAYILQKACPNQYKQSSEILQSSFQDEVDGDILPSSNGFVNAVVRAYNEHHALIIRPDDVWLAILVQFSFYVNGNAELLRSQFVRHEGKKELVVYAQGNRYTVDFGHMAKSMTDLIEDNVVDPALRQWIMPSFSTTTLNDTVVCSVVMMATTKAYFSYKFVLRCGIPRVTLEGQKDDWENILGRLEKLKEYGIETIAFYHLLVPVIKKFVQAFDHPNGRDNLEFWQNVAHYSGGGSGPTFLSGWITAFCAFNEKGEWVGNTFLETPKRPLPTGPASLSAVEFWSIYIDEGSLYPRPSPFAADPDQENFHLALNGAHYHRIDTDDIPCSFAEVDVKLCDNGQLFDTLMTAGHVGQRVQSSRDIRLSGTGVNDTLRPIAGWWIFIKREAGDGEKDHHRSSRRTRRQSASSYAPPPAVVPQPVIPTFFRSRRPNRTPSPVERGRPSTPEPRPPTPPPKDPVAQNPARRRRRTLSKPRPPSRSSSIRPPTRQASVSRASTAHVSEKPNRKASTTESRGHKRRSSKASTPTGRQRSDTLNSKSPTSPTSTSPTYTATSLNRSTSTRRTLSRKRPPRKSEPKTTSRFSRCICM